MGTINPKLADMDRSYGCQTSLANSAHRMAEDLICDIINNIPAQTGNQNSNIPPASLSNVLQSPQSNRETGAGSAILKVADGVGEGNNGVRDSRSGPTPGLSDTSATQWGVDYKFLGLLSKDLQSEVIEELRKIGASQQPSAQQEQAGDAGQGLGEMNTEFLAALPHHIRREVLARHNSVLQRQKTTQADPLQDLCQFPVAGSTKGVGSVTVRLGDYNSLEVTRFLNDVIIDFYMKYLQFMKLSETDRNRVHIVSTYWYSNLADGYDRVKRWTKGVNIFEKDFVVVPINESLHWYLAVICYPGLVEHQKRTSNHHLRFEVEQEKDGNKGSQVFDPDKKPCILLFDSIGVGQDKERLLCASLRDFLTQEYNRIYPNECQYRKFSASTMPGSSPKVPLQSNGEDCGLFLLHYVETFFKHPIKNFSLPITSLGSWFPDTEIKTKRSEIAAIIRTLAREQNQNNLEQLNIPDLQFVDPDKHAQPSKSFDNAVYRLDLKFKKLKMGTPSYNFIRVGQDWKTSVKILDKIVTGEKRGKKKDAKQCAARIAEKILDDHDKDLNHNNEYCKKIQFSHCQPRKDSFMKRDQGEVISISNSNEMKPQQKSPQTTQKPGSSEFTIKEVSGNLFGAPNINTESLCHCISQDYKLGKGIAKLFRDKFGRIDELKDTGARVGGLSVLEERGRYIYCLVTKEKYSDKPLYISLKESLEAMRSHCISHGVSNISMPRLGCGRDGLSWAFVRTLVKNVFQLVPVKITVYRLDRDPLVSRGGKAPSDNRSMMPRVAKNSVPSHDSCKRQRQLETEFDDERRATKRGKKEQDPNFENWKGTRGYTMSLDILDKIGEKVLFDAHCHLDFSILWKSQKDFETYDHFVQAYPLMEHPSLAGFITNFCCPQIWMEHLVSRSPLMRSLLSRPSVYYTIGCHPHYASDLLSPYMFSQFELLISRASANCIAIGECGLDRSSKNTTPLQDQKRIFKMQVRMAMKWSKPVVLHIRDAEREALEALEEEGLPVDWPIHRHCWNDSWEVCQEWLSKFTNSVVGITPLVTFPHKKDLHRVVKLLPLDKLVLETDAPYFLPRGGGPNSLLGHTDKNFSLPTHVANVAAQVAVLKNCQVTKVLSASRENIRRVYNV